MANERELSEKWENDARVRYASKGRYPGVAQVLDNCADELDAWVPGLLAEVRREVIEECGIELDKNADSWRKLIDDKHEGKEATIRVDAFEEAAAEVRALAELHAAPGGEQK